MTCGHCEARVSKAARKIKGVGSATASFPHNRLEATYDYDMIDEDRLVSAVMEAVTAEGYRVVGADKNAQPISKVVPIVLIIMAVYLVLRYTVGFDFFGYISKFDSTISLARCLSRGCLHRDVRRHQPLPERRHNRSDQTQAAKSNSV